MCRNTRKSVRNIRSCFPITVSLFDLLTAGNLLTTWEEGKYLRVAFLVSAFLEILNKPNATRTTTAPRVGCILRGLGRKTPFFKAAEDDLRPSILQPNTEGLTASKIIVLVLEQLAHRNIGACHRLLGNPPLRNYSQSIDSQLPTSWALVNHISE